MAKSRKVIRTKTLYKKSLIPPKVAGAILFLLLILFIVIVGFVLMHEMTTRFGDDDSNNDVSTPVEESIPSSSEVVPPSSNLPEEEVLDEIFDISKIAFIDSATISAGKDAIEQKLEMYIQDEFTAVAFELKPYTGKLSYNSEVSTAVELKAIAEDNDLISLKEIVDLSEKLDIIPVAYMSTLRDQTTAHVQYENSYAYSTYLTTNWLDNSVDLGGKSWLNPYMENTQDYISDLSKEMYKAGFNTILLDNVIYPTQNTGMMNTIKTTPSKEQMLNDFVGIIEKSVPDAKVIRIEDLTFTATIDYSSEVSMANYNTVLSRCESENIAVFMSLDNIAKSKGQIILRENLSVDNNAENIEVYKELLKKAMDTLKTDITVVVTQKDFDEVLSVLEEFDIVSYMVTN